MISFPTVTWAGPISGELGVMMWVYTSYSRRQLRRRNFYQWRYIPLTNRVRGPYYKIQTAFFPLQLALGPLIEVEETRCHILQYGQKTRLIRSLLYLLGIELSRNAYNEVKQFVLSNTRDGLAGQLNQSITVHVVSDRYDKILLLALDLRPYLYVYLSVLGFYGAFKWWQYPGSSCCSWGESNGAFVIYILLEFHNFLFLKQNSYLSELCSFFIFYFLFSFQGMSKVFGGMQHHRIAQVCWDFSDNFCQNVMAHSGL